MGKISTDIKISQLVKPGIGYPDGDTTHHGWSHCGFHVLQKMNEKLRSDDLRTQLREEFYG